ncbi:MAG TPA: ATP-binding protein [Thermoanaerobaculia bacterium]|nr:ATP-binding protein [Thermoanaerobaculia bacterium]
MILAISRCRAPQERSAPFLLDEAGLAPTVPGFLGLETFLSVAEEGICYLVTRWTDEDSFWGWHASGQDRPEPDGPVVLARVGELLLEQEIADSQLLFARVLRETKTIYYLHADDQGTILACSSAWEDLLGVPRSRLAGQPLWRHLPDADAEALQHRIRETRRGESFLLNVCDNSGQPHTLSCHLDARPKGFVLVGEPAYTEMRELQEELIRLNNELAVLARERGRLLDSERRARQEAEKASRLKDEFLAMVSHELRNPLHGVLHWAQLLETQRLDEAGTQRALGAIQRNVWTQVKLIEDLLDAARIRSGTLRLDLQPVSPAVLVSAAMEAVRPAAEQKRIVLVGSAQAVEGSVQADPGRLEQALVNLLSNAIKFTPEEGRVEVVLERDGDEVLFRVSDSGPGIPSDLIPHLFEPFRQGAQVRGERGSGLGLGLAITSHIVKLHKGRIDVSSGPGRGATFTIRLAAGEG